MMEKPAAKKIRSWDMAEKPVKHRGMGMVEKPVIGTKTMVVSPHYLASAAGARMLEKGGMPLMQRWRSVRH